MKLRKHFGNEESVVLKQLKEAGEVCGLSTPCTGVSPICAKSPAKRRQVSFGTPVRREGKASFARSPPLRQVTNSVALSSGTSPTAVAV